MTTFGDNFVPFSINIQLFELQLSDYKMASFSSKQRLPTSVTAAVYSVTENN